MQGSITLNELGIFIIFILIAVAVGYAIVTLKNMNGFIKRANDLLQRNTDHFNRIIPNIYQISENTANISEEFKNSIGEAGEAIRTISHETTDTVSTINETAEYLANYALMIGEIVKTIVNMFSSNEKE
jgi:predicted PurR-regulated permease PerM